MTLLARLSQKASGSASAVASALKGVEVERIVGPGRDAFVLMGSFWQEQPVVLHFLRRFGCRLCRGAALDMSRAIPHLRSAGVRVVAIGPEAFGVDEFVDGNYWGGEVYVDEGKKAYKALRLKSMSYFELAMLFLNPKMAESLEKTKNVAGNLSGDIYQLGATFILNRGGASLLEFRQESPTEHLSPEQLLEAFGIDGKVLTSGGEDESQEQVKADDGSGRQAKSAEVCDDSNCTT